MRKGLHIIRALYPEISLAPPDPAGEMGRYLEESAEAFFPAGHEYEVELLETGEVEVRKDGRPFMWMPLSTWQWLRRHNVEEEANG